uniref:Glycosyl transferase family 1 domain-containing protein n=1 Tax=Neobodo designis TaxID=312471 RepID=A0A7S1M7U1_NEODS
MRRGRRATTCAPSKWLVGVVLLSAALLVWRVIIGPNGRGVRESGSAASDQAEGHHDSIGDKHVAVVVFATNPETVVAHMHTLWGCDPTADTLIVAPTHDIDTLREGLTKQKRHSWKLWSYTEPTTRSAVVREAVGVALSNFPHATHVMLSTTSRRPIESNFLRSLLEPLGNQEWSVSTCTSVFEGEDQNLYVEDMGLDAAEGNLGLETAPFILRRFHGLSMNSHRLAGQHTADFVTPHCTLMPRRVANLFVATTDGVDIGIPDPLTVEKWIVEPSTRLHFLGLGVLNFHQLRGQPTPEDGAIIAQVDNFRRNIIPKLKAYARRFGNASRLIARLDAPQWRPRVIDNSTANVQRAFLEQVRTIMDTYRRFLLIDLDAGSLSGDLLLLKLSHQIRKFGGRLFAVRSFARVITSALPREVSELVALHGFRIRAASVPLLAGPIVPRIPGEVLSGSFRGSEQTSAKTVVVWDTVCCGCCGFSSEIMHFLHPLRQLRRVRVTVGQDCFCNGYDAYVSDNIMRMSMEPAGLPLIAPPSDIVIWVSHAGPWSYYNHELVLRRPDYFVGRSMYEFTKIPKQWVAQIKPINEVWAPGKWVRDVFVANGIDASKIIVMPEAIDVEYFDPGVRRTIPLPLVGRHLKWKRFCNGAGSASNFKFFSNFKWEPRKGWEILFEAYFREFSRSAAVSLYVLTNVVGTMLSNVTQIESQFELWAATRGLNTDMRSKPHFCIITETIPEELIGDLYNSADAFVLPTRGEGWGLPTIQAMSLGKPTISTAWGGQMEFMSRETSFMIELDGLEEIPEDSIYGHDLGKKWAVPSVRHTAELMRYVMTEREHAAAVGRRARAHIVAHFSEEAVALLADKRFHEIESWIRHLRSLKR